MKEKPRFRDLRVTVQAYNLCSNLIHFLALWLATQKYYQKKKKKKIEKLHTVAVRGFIALRFMF